MNAKSRKKIIFGVGLITLVVVTALLQIPSVRHEFAQLFQSSSPKSSLIRAQPLTPAQVAAEAQANHLTRLSAGEFAVIKSSFGKPSGKKTKTAITLSTGQVYTLESDTETVMEIIEGSNDAHILIDETNPNIEIQSVDQLGAASIFDNKVAKEVTNRLTDLAAQETVPVIITFNLPFPSVYKKNPTAADIIDRRAKFNEAKAAVQGLLLGTSRLDRNLELINAVSAKIDKATVLKLQNSPFVKSINFDGLVHIVLDTSVQEISAPAVWALSDANGNPVTGIGRRIAVIDTGVDYTHPDLGSCFGPSCKVIGGWDFVNNDGNPMDDQGHGTHVAATAAGNGPGPAGKGVAPGAKILAYKVCYPSGNSASCPDSAVIDAIQRATDPNNDGNPADHADVATISLGGPGNPDDEMSLAVDQASALGVVSTIAAGNAGPGASTILSPGTARTGITVAAACKNAQVGAFGTCATPIASFSSRGPLIWSGVNIQKPDIAAPGVFICAARWNSAFGSSPTCFDSQHVRISGTSMATPHLAGAAALVRQAFPNFEPADVKQLLKATAQSLPGVTYNDQGAGRVNLAAAVTITQFIASTPNTWNITTNPTSKFSTHTQNFSITSLAPAINTLTVSFNDLPAGVTAVSNPSVINVAGGGTASIQVTLTVDNDLALSGSYLPTIRFSEGGAVKGAIPVFLNITPTLTVTPAGTLDYGVDPPNLTSWTSPLLPVTVTNLRTDVAQNAAISSSAFPPGITFLVPATVSVSALGTASFNTGFTVDNTQAPNAIYNGTLTIANGANTIARPTKFAKFYTLTVQDTDPPGDKPALVKIFRNPSGPYTAFALNLNIGPAIFYLEAPGSFEVIVTYLPKPTDFSTNPPTPGDPHIYWVVAENQNVATTLTLNVSKYQANKTITLVGTDAAGLTHNLFPGEVLQLTYLQASFFNTHLRHSSINELDGQSFVSAISPNYEYAVVYEWPIQIAQNLHIFRGAAAGIQNNITFTNTPSDFKILDFRLDTDQGGPIFPLIRTCPQLSSNNNCGVHFSLGTSLPNHVVQRVHSLLAPTSKIFQTVSDISPTTATHYSPYVSFENPIKRWLVSIGTPQLYLPSPQGNTLYTGLGPPYWAGRLANTPNTINLKLAWSNPNQYVNGSDLFLRQDYARKDYAGGIAFGVYNTSGVQVGSGTLPAPFTGAALDPTVASSTVGLPGAYELRIDFPYQNSGINLAAKVRANFNTSLADPNPPAFTKFHYFAGVPRSEFYTPGLANHLEFTLDPVGGTIGSLGVSYSTNGINFAPLSVTSGLGGYTVDLPSLSGITKVTIKIVAADDASNSLSYSFELPVGAAPPACTLTAFPSSGMVPLSGTLSWTTYNNPTACTASGSWSGSQNPAPGTAPYGPLSTNGTYTYNLTCSNANGSGICSTSVIAFPLSVPTPPTNLALTNIQPNSITLNWTDNSSNENTFWILRKVGLSGIFLSLTTTVPANATTYTDLTVSPNQYYAYKVCALNAAGCSAFTNEAGATTPAGTPPPPPSIPASPSNLFLTNVMVDRITLNWTDNANNEGGFLIQRKVGLTGTFFDLVTNLAANSIAYNDLTVGPNQYYAYRVRAFNTAGFSNFSNEASTTTPALSPPPPPPSPSPSPAGLPDLIIQSASLSPSAPVVNNSLSISGVVKNQGTGSAALSQTRLRIDIGNNGTWDVNPSNMSTGALAPNAAETESWANVWTATIGTHRFEICADAPGAIIELIDTNNCLIQTFLVSSGSLPPDTTPPTTTILNPLNNSTLPNQGSVQISSAAADASGVKQIKIFTDSILKKTCNFNNPPVSANCSTNWPMSQVTSGPHTITVTAKDNSLNQNEASVSITVFKP